MKGNIAIIAALPGELKFVLARRKWQRIPASNGVSLWEYQRGVSTWVAACAGMSGVRATAAWDAVRRHGPVDMVCSAGWAGALDARLRPGAVVLGSLVIDTRTGERFRPEPWVEGMPVLVSTEGVADAEEKKRLAAAYGAGLVDMEAATVARLALANGIPFYSIKAISDAADAKLPELNRFIDARGSIKMAPFITHVALRPSVWPSLIRLGKNSSMAAENLATALYDWLDDREYVHPRTAD